MSAIGTASDRPQAAQQLTRRGKEVDRIVVSAVRPDYQKTVGAMIEAQSGNADIMRGDPAKVARVILRIASEKRPPLRLLLGSDAVFLASLASAERAKEDAQWKELSFSTDFDGLADFSETPIAKTDRDQLLRGGERHTRSAASLPHTT